MRPRSLLILLLAAFAIFSIWSVWMPEKSNAFVVDLINIDTAAISSITITKGAQQITLTREPVGWIASNGQISVKALPHPVQSVLNSVSQIQTSHIVTSSSKAWKEYRIGNETGTHIKVFNQLKVLEDFYLGTDQTDSTRLRYIRLNGENEVYQINGKEIAAILTDITPFRSPKLIQLPSDQDIDHLRFGVQDSVIHELLKKDQQWYTNEPRTVDSVSIEKYFKGLTNISSRNFADDFDELSTEKIPKQTIKLWTENDRDSIVVDCYLDTLDYHSFILRSNQNEAFFHSDSSGLFNTIFLEFMQIIDNKDE